VAQTEGSHSRSKEFQGQYFADCSVELTRYIHMNALWLSHMPRKILLSEVSRGRDH